MSLKNNFHVFIYRTMKYLKSYENKKFEFKYNIGDYVICQETGNSYGNPPTSLVRFINNNIGRIVSLGEDPDSFGDGVYNVTFDNIHPLFIKNKSFTIIIGDKEYSRYMRDEEIVDSAKTKEELEMKILAKKYNIR